MVFHYKSLINVDDRILLYLLNNNYHNSELGEFGVLGFLTTEQIAAAVLTDRNNMSYHITKLKNQEYIEGILTRVSGKKRKQRVYNLTVAGRRKAAEIKRKVMDKNITIFKSGKKIKNLQFPEVANFLKNSKLCGELTDYEILKFADHKGNLEINNITDIERDYLDLTEGALKPRYFFGREKELEQLTTWIDKKNLNNVIVIHGIAGIGKTTLASKLIEKYRGKKHLFWHTFNTWDTIRSVVSHIVEFLSKLEDGYLKAYVDFNKPLDLDKIMELFKKKLVNLNALLVFDDFQKVNEELRDFFASILSISEKTDNLSFLILTRYNIPFYDQQRILVRNSVVELEVEGLDFESSSEILRRKHLPKTRFKDIYNITSGHPLLLEIIESGKRAKRYIYEEIFSKLTTEEQTIMEILSTYRVSIPYEAFFIDDKILPGSIENLIKKLIVRETPAGYYYTHEFIKDFFYKRMSPQGKRKYHKFCAEFHMDQEGSVDHLEAFYHYMKLQQYPTVVVLAVEKGQEIIAAGLSDRFLNTLEELSEEEISLPQWTDILMLKGRLSFITGGWDKAIEYYDRAVEACTEIGEEPIKAKAYCELGHIYEEQNLLEDAFASFQNCLEISKKIKDNKILAEAKRGVGRYYWRKSDYDTAKKYYKESLKALTGTDNYKLIGAIHIDLGNVHFETQKYDRAIDFLKKALQYLEKIDDKLEIARAYNNLGTVYTYLKKFEIAIEYYKRELDLVETIGDIRLLSYGLSNIAYCYAKLDFFSDAEYYIKRAGEISEKTKNENILFKIYKTNGLIHQHYGRWDKAIDSFNKSIAIIEKLDGTFFLVDTLYELGLLFKKKGELGKAKTYFKQVEQIRGRLSLST